MSLINEGKRLFINKLKGYMVESINEAMPCKFHVDIDKVSETSNSTAYHKDTTHVESIQTAFGQLEIFHYYDARDLIQVMHMNIYPHSFAVKHVLEKSTATGLPPILNFKAQSIDSIGCKMWKGITSLKQIEMTKAEYKEIPPYHKEYHYSISQIYRFRVVELADGYKSVFLIDSKNHPNPDTNL